MQSKLEELARKEEALRKINDELDIKKHKILQGSDDFEESKGNEDGDSADSFD